MTDNTVENKAVPVHCWCASRCLYVVGQRALCILGCSLLDMEH